MDWHRNPPPVRELVPHTGDMVLLDRIVSLEEGHLIAAVDLGKPSPFRDHTGAVPAYVGIEYLVQAVSVIGGIASRAKGDLPRIGLLLGARAFKSCVSHFPTAGELLIQVREKFIEPPIAVFAGEISCDGKRLAEGEIKAIQPMDDESLDEIFAAIQ